MKQPCSKKCKVHMSAENSAGKLHKGRPSNHPQFVDLRNTKKKQRALTLKSGANKQNSFVQSQSGSKKRTVMNRKMHRCPPPPSKKSKFQFQNNFTHHVPVWKIDVPSRELTYQRKIIFKMPFWGGYVSSLEGGYQDFQKNGWKHLQRNAAGLHEVGHRQHRGMSDGTSWRFVVKNPKGGWWLFKDRKT